MEYECSELKALLDQAEDGVIPWDLKPQVESHLENCRTCSAKLSGFLKIQNILTATVYGDPCRDNYLAFLSQVAGTKFSWGPPGEKQPQASPGGRLRMMLKIFAGFVVAAGLGISGLVVFGRSGCFHRGPVAPAPVPAVQDELASAPETGPPPPAAKIAPEENAAADTPETIDRPASDPKAIYLELNRPEQTPASPAPAQPAFADSTRLRVLEAELGALRDAVSRTPRDRTLVKRAMDKYRQVITERKGLKQPSRVRDYYNLGYMHYLSEEYPQTAIVTEEGIRMARLGPVEYLHYLKAMSHYRIAQQAVQPLPADTTADESARRAGATLRAGLDAEGRRQAITELRRAISEFNFLLKNPELEQPAGEWILKCSSMVEQLSASP